MSTLSGFTRPADPIKVSDLANRIAQVFQSNVTVTVNPTDVIVSADNITEASKPTIQTILDNYYYTDDMRAVGVNIADNPDMSSARHNYAITEYAAYKSDMAIYDATRNRAYINGELVNDVVIYQNTVLTDNLGNAVFYLTKDKTATGAAIFSSIDPGTIQAMPYGNVTNYQVSSLNVSADKKTVTVGVNQLKLVGLTIAAAGNGVPVNLLLTGK